jgi:hypothetical protein
VVVLEPGQRRPVDPLGDRVGELPVDGAVVIPVVGIVTDPGESGVTQRPEHLVAEPVVVPLYLPVAEPDSFERVALAVAVRRDRHAPVLVDRSPVGTAVAPGDPPSVDLAHDGVQSRGQPAPRTVDLDPVSGLAVTVRLPVRDHDEAVVPVCRRSPVP